MNFQILLDSLGITSVGVSYRHPYNQSFLKCGDGKTLVTTPYRHGPFSSIEGFGSALLFQGNELEALVVERLPLPLPYVGFWSRGTVTRYELAMYLVSSSLVVQQCLESQGLYVPMSIGKVRAFSSIPSGIGLVDDLKAERVASLEKNPLSSYDTQLNL